MPAPPPRDGPAVQVRRSAHRAGARLPGLVSRHSFAFGRAYDAGNTHHGALLANNEEVIAAGAGFAAHPHVDVEIVTWVLRGTLVHADSAGNAGVVHPGLAQRLSAGRGVLHSEHNGAGGDPTDLRAGRGRPAEPVPEDPGAVHFVQMWVRPDDSGGDPGYAQAEVDESALASGLVPVAAGADGPPAAVGLGRRGATLYAARLRAGQSVQVPEAAFVHLFLPVGAALLEDVGDLAAGDAVRFTACGGHRVTAAAPAELLIWQLQR